MQINHSPRHGHRRLALFVLFFCGCLSGLPAGGSAPPPSLDRIFQKKEITVLITDSGLGGLSVCAELEKGLRQQGVFQKVRLVFANALPDTAHTYNSMRSREEQIQALDAALGGMVKRFRPDVALIACNTLSVLYPDTRFAQAASIPVLGIVESGVRILAEKLQQNPASRLILFGTPITIREAAHQKGLLRTGVDVGRITVQACPNLETEIQADPKSDVVRNLVEACAREALGQGALPPSAPLVAGLCCSHYGYSQELFRQILQELSGGKVEVVDPNLEMSRLFLNQGMVSRFPETATTVEVVSRVPLSQEERQSIAFLLTMTSPATAEALIGYQRQADLFPFPPGGGSK